jgi:hypothetical protein
VVAAPPVTIPRFFVRRRSRVRISDKPPFKKMTSAPFRPRRLGDFLLVAQLSEDALGTVYRAVHESEEGRFLRLRVLQSPELSPGDVPQII